jgi:hypothetical protein
MGISITKKQMVSPIETAVMAAMLLALEKILINFMLLSSLYRCFHGDDKP